jgi:spore coat protein CotH
MIFNAKRRQRIIKIIKPLQNTTVGFVKTVSNLYFETQDHKNLIDKKITYFLEKIRTDYNLDTSTLNEEFIEKLTSKTGKKKDDIKKLIDFIDWLKSKNEFFEENLVKLNRHIEAFYSK